jgi:ankyrin repeat protein
LSVVRMLLERGADELIRDLDGNTALYYATRNMHQSVVQLLLSA